MTRHQRPAEVYSITDTRSSHDDELHSRMRRYLISMSVRTVCFILAVLTPSPLRWVFVAAAVVLPYVAVIAANAGPRRRSSTNTGYTPPKPAVEDDARGRLEP